MGHNRALQLSCGYTKTYEKTCEKSVGGSVTLTGFESLQPVSITLWSVSRMLQKIRIARKCLEFVNLQLGNSVILF